MSNMIITISRSYGSGGRVIGRMLSENLKIPYYDRNLCWQMCESYFEKQRT